MPQSEIQILTHCDPMRAIRVCLLARSVPNTIEVLCAVNGSDDQIRSRLGRETLPQNLRFFPTIQTSVYPANALRNIALAHATAEWVFYIDCDFVFCNGFWSSLGAALRLTLAKLGDRVCICPVPLWDPEGRYLTIELSAAVIETETCESHRPPADWRDTNHTQLFRYHDRYVRPDFGPAASPYEVTRRMLELRRSSTPAEPWGLLRRTHMSWADEDFRSGPMDKQQFVASLLDRGLRFLVVPNVFIFHLWHPNQHQGWPDRIRNRTLWARRYTGRPHYYLLVDIGGALPPELAQCFENELKNVLPSDLGISEEKGFAQMTEAAARVEVTHDCLSRQLLAGGRAAIVFFRSPVFYRAVGRIDDSRVYANLFAGVPETDQAISQIDNVTLLCDMADIPACVRALRNVTGITVDPSWFSGGESLFPDVSSTEVIDRRIHPADYLIYDYARTLARKSS